ncbi:cuticle protein 19.8-like [Daphnia carinata]|uniref:cuticle protein 19.8-like n=1 Tax=Daphnia carinata TaxID=120202 RepID=UPI00257BD164|nr:cuticle protein 19.8-like [Daphnia carinata]
MNVFIFTVLCTMTTIAIGQDDSTWQEPVSGRDSTLEYGPAPVKAPPSDPIAVTIPTTAKAIATAYSAALVQPAPPGPVKFPEQTSAAMPLMPYSFEYGVDDDASGLDFGHKESSDGAIVTGTYYVLLPDGRMETVNYKADGNGYVAEVSYEGEAKYDAVQTQQSGGTTSGTSGQLQVSSNTGAPSNRPPQPPSVPTGAPKAPTQPAAVPSKAPQVSAPVWPAVKPPVVPNAPVVSPTLSVPPAIPTIVNAPAPVPVYGPVPTSAPAANWPLSSPQLSQAPAIPIPVTPAGFARSPVQVGVQASYGQAAPPSAIPPYPVGPTPLSQRNTPKPRSNPYSI